MGILLDNQKTNIRFEYDDIVIYHPTSKQVDEIKELIKNNIMLQSQDNEVLSLECIKYILKELTNIKEDYDNITNEELGMLLSNGKRNIELMLRDIESLLNEIKDDIIYTNIQLMKQINSLLNILNYNNEHEKMINKLNKLMKKNKIDFDLNKIDPTNPQSLLLIIEEFTKQLNKNI